ncbi:MAG: HD domain-containing phosphohydrolase [Pseudomonadota bacterium]
MSDASIQSMPDLRPETTVLFQLPAAAAQARSKYLAQGFLVFVGAAFLLGTFLIARWSSFSLEQQALFWDSKLSQGAYMTAAQVETQLKVRQQPWVRLARSDAIKLYAMEALSTDSDRAQGSRDYLENALLLTLEREGLAGTSASSSRVNVSQTGEGRTRSGAVLVAANGQALLSFGGARTAPLSAGPPTQVTTQDGFQARFYGPYGDAAALPNAPTQGWFTLVVGIEAVQSPQIIAELHVTYPLSALGLLSEDMAQVLNPALRTVLIDPQTDSLLSREEGSIVLRKMPGFLGDERYRWAGARGQGTARAKTPNGDDMLVAAQRVDGTRWIAVQSIPTDVAMQDIRRQTWIWLLGSIIALGLACGLILLAWRRGVAHRAAAIAAARDSAGDALAQANSLLTNMADSQPSAVILVDDSDTAVFANQAALHIYGFESDAAIVGRPLSQCLAADVSRPLLRAIESARAVGSEISAATEIQTHDGLRHGRITAAPLRSDEADGLVMLAFDDVTPIVTLRARREASLRSLVTVLTGLIDARDPHSARHSRSVARLSRSVARALNYGDDAQRDVEMAALVSNAGKILVPRSLLTRPDTLTGEELSTVRSAVQRTSALLEDVDFDGEVRAILEALEQRDAPGAPGSGPAQAADIIKASNALIGMVSPRAHRDAMALEDALSALEADTSDKHVLAAISHGVRNQGALEKALS